MAVTAHEPTPRADVELRLPADRAFASVLRTTSAALAARLDFTVDDIEDLRIAVGEATAMLLPEAAEGADLVALFRLGRDSMSVEVQVALDGAVEPDLDSFAWQVLTTLAAESDIEVTETAMSVRLRVNSTAGAQSNGLSEPVQAR